MAEVIQISAVVSRTTKDLLERHVRETGVKKGRLIEAALLHHLRALRELPSEYVVPAHIVVSRKSGERILQRMASPRHTPGLRKLMSKHGNPPPQGRR